MSFLKIKNLNVETSDSNGKILDNVNLEIESGKIYFLSGRNGSGKTTLANVIIGNPKYDFSGEILFNREDISKISPYERARRGIFMSFQFPNEVPGVNFFSFLRTAYNSVHEEKLSLLEFRKLIREKSNVLGVSEEFLEKNLNENLSGGEKKKMEILQMLVLNPKLVILDEVDSGLDKESFEIISREIKNFVDNDKAVLMITHNEKARDYINPEKIFRIDKGRIIEK